MSVEYLLTDHLGSTSLTTDSSGVKVSEMRYKPWGEVRYAWRTTSQTTKPAYALTRYTFTGQYSHMDDPTTSGVTEGFGLMFYNARWYDPALGRFSSADSLVPEQSQGVQAWDRYAYVNNSPVNFTDPSGHCPLCLTAAIGGSIGAIVGALGYTAYAAYTGQGFNTTHMLLAAGGGAVAGALIGTGVGIAAGVGVAEATTAAVTTGTAIEGASAACGGDMCASEIEDIGRVFWSGGSVAQSAANTWATANNAITLEMTEAGQGLQAITKEMDYLTEAKPLWEAASAEFAQGATGTVNVFLNAAGIDPESIWLTIEEPILIENGVKIIRHFVE